MKRFLFLLIALVVFISSSNASTFTVCPDCNFTSIQEAIDTSNPGDTIIVLNSTYYENIIINKPLTLQGENRDTTIIDGSGNGDVVLITANNSVLKSFKIINSGINPSGLPYNGVKLLSVNNCVVTGNNVSNNDHGIALWTYSNNNLIKDNNAFYNNAGIIIADESKYNTIRENNASFNFYHGINPYLNSNENVIINNTVLNNGYYGITPSSAHNNILTENFISGNSYGIYTYSYFSQSSGNLIYRNNIIGNINQAYDDSGLNFWDNGTVGNHWSNYDEPGEGCNDIDYNGVCDSPYLVSGESVDNFPLVTWSSPTPIPAPTTASLQFKLTNNNTNQPIAGAIVQLGGKFKGNTDENGIVTFEVSLGDYKYKVRMKEFIKDKGIVSVTGDTIIFIKLMPKKGSKF